LADSVKEDRPKHQHISNFAGTCRVFPRPGAVLHVAQSTTRGDRVDLRALNRESGEASSQATAKPSEESEVLSQATQALEKSQKTKVRKRSGDSRRSTHSEEKNPSRAKMTAAL
jgi:hypothetical protein